MIRTMAVLAVLAVLARVLPAAAYNVFVNVNQWPYTMVSEANAWAQTAALMDGMFGFSASHPFLPMSAGDRTQLVQMVGRGPKVLIATYPSLMGDNIRNVNWANILQWGANLAGGLFTPTEVYTWSSGGLRITPSELDFLASVNFPPVLINIRGWEKNLTSEDGTNRAAVQASIDHPACKGVVIEGNPEALTRPIYKLNQRLQVASYVVSIGKPVYFLQPPPWDPRDGETMLGKLAAMLTVMRAAPILGPAMCTGQVTLVPSAYTSDLVAGNPTYDFLPELNADGSIANMTYAGGVLYLALQKTLGCPTPAGANSR